MSDRVGELERTLISRGQDVHLLAHQGENHGDELNEGAWRTCPLDPCVSDRALLNPPRSFEPLPVILGIRVRAKLDEMERSVTERNSALREWMNERRSAT